MTTLTIEIPEKDVALLKEIFKRFDVVIKNERAEKQEFIEETWEGNADIRVEHTIKLKG